MIQMATAKKLPSGSYRVQLYIGKDANGKRQYKSFTADTKKEAEYLAAKYSPKTCRNAHGLLTAVLQVYRPDFVLHTTLPQKSKREIYVPDAQEVMDILQMVKGTVNELPVFLAAECGMRAEEIAALRKCNITPDHIDIKEAIVIDRNLEQVVKKPKSTSGFRSVPITQKAYDYIMSLADEGDRVCNRSNEAISNNWVGFKQRHKSKISPHLNFHAFRHHYASKLLLLNIPQKYIAELMGHGSTDMIEQVYQHIFPSAIDEYKRAIRESMQHEMQHDE